MNILSVTQYVYGCVCGRQGIMHLFSPNLHANEGNSSYPKTQPIVLSTNKQPRHCYLSPHIQHLA